MNGKTTRQCCSRATSNGESAPCWKLDADPEVHGDTLALSSTAAAPC